MNKRYNILLAGKAGQGANILSEIIASLLLKKGFSVFNYRDYQSLIRGGHSFNVVCFSDKEINSFDEEVNVLIVLDKESLAIHGNKINDKTVIISCVENLCENYVFVEVNTHKKIANIALLAAFCKIASISKELILKEIERRFSGKKFYQLDVEAINIFYDKEYTVNFDLSIKSSDSGDCDFLTGSESVAQAAIDTGLDICYGYPMTPATNVFALISKSEKVFSFALENELAVINAALGSSFVGKKVMVGTSGGGFDLMTEGLSMAGMMELPLIIHLGQRAGAGSGVPTYTGQGDLNAALYAGHGDFVRVVVAPGDASEAYSCTIEAMYLAEKFSIPIILLTDKHLLESHFTCNLEKQDIKFPIRKQLPSNEVFKKNSYEHDAEGNTTEDASVVAKSVIKREEKRLLLKEKFNDSKNFKTHQLYGQGEKLIVSFGSNKGAIIDALEDLENHSFLHLIYLEPFSSATLEIINKFEEIYVVECNSSSQLAGLLKKEDYRGKIKNILKFDGRPFLPKEIIERLDNA
jgi:2-oxoglutarate/2-oxoacid ferredoxin oxidoreductase subunit alpha